ncbi:recombinase family protein [Peribacillus simplex]|uniref:recombinase family protein n=1 Tax=Peribacillus simplex TaxID=1478 RepID=UPI003D291DC0
MEKKAKLGKWKGGITPYGYKVVNKELVINKDEEMIVKTIFELSKSSGFYTIAKVLSERGYSTRKGSDWHVDTVRDIANNPIYAGYLTFNENLKQYKKPPREQVLYEGIHERIIPRDDFWALQDTLDKRRTYGGKRETSNYYFSSILKCGRLANLFEESVREYGDNIAVRNKDKQFTYKEFIFIIFPHYFKYVPDATVNI